MCRRFGSSALAQVPFSFHRSLHSIQSDWLAGTVVPVWSAVSVSWNTSSCAMWHMAAASRCCLRLSRPRLEERRGAASLVTAWPAYENKLKTAGLNEAAIAALKYNFKVLTSWGFDHDSGQRHPARGFAANLEDFSPRAMSFSRPRIGRRHGPGQGQVASEGHREFTYGSLAK